MSDQIRSTHSQQTQTQNGNDHPSVMLDELIKQLDGVVVDNPRLANADDPATPQANDLRALLEVSLAITSTLDINATIRLVLTKAIELMDAERGMIMLLVNDTEQFRAGIDRTGRTLHRNDFPVSDTITSDVFRKGESIYTSDASTDDRYALQQSIVAHGLRSIMCVPLKIKDTVIGLIYVDNPYDSKVFLRADLLQLELYAQLAASAIYNADIYDRLRRMERFNQSIVDNSPVGLMVIDSEGHLSAINKSALEILELNRDQIRLFGHDLMPTRLAELLPEAEWRRWRTMISDVVTTQSEFSESRHYHNTGYVEKVLSLRLSPIDDLAANLKGIIVTLEDITEKVTMEQYVILSEKLVARGEMAASVAHELNNFLTIISNNAEIMAMNLDRGLPDKAKFNAKSILDNVFRIKRFVDSLMDFSNPEADYINYDIRQLVDDLLFSLKIQPRMKTVQFTVDMGQEIPSCEIDVGQIQQILINLLNNAADAIQERVSRLGESDPPHIRKIGLKALYDQTTDLVHVEISDNGIGMSPEVQGKIFTPHFTMKKGGHGLGLYNCLKIAKQHGGAITVNSTPNIGTTFTLSIPRTRPKVEVKP